MQKMIPTRLAAVALGALAFCVPQAQAQTTAHSHTHAAEMHTHGADEIYHGHFADSQIAPRTLADWQGDWQSVYPLLQDGTLDPVMDHKAAKGDKSAADYHAMYEVGYQTDVDHIKIDGKTVTFFQDGKAFGGTYENDGYEVLTYKAGNRGVRYIFEKVAGDAQAPAFIQFSDHAIAPQTAGHFHLYWGDDRAALLDEVTNWPTYYPTAKSGAQIAAEMMAH
ncbi:metal-binding protein ZinT [Pseudosulfitobacter sp. DSM 107133]|uniref:ZinT family metal-binding protein n=1 Tax=Pseudosulfitobacter sp. DSM 107133 TaxID=2883100 RepID=UPI000DF2A548|nr:metal-binding protein ZinT [Pseudosulfitobacter sp. DSM 107133]UOA28486.1 Metal-binding protein ZinT [Pseudosulfitobacter sp. DSM 107133]